MEVLEPRRLFAVIGQPIPTFGDGGVVSIARDPNTLPSTVMSTLSDGKFIVAEASGVTSGAVDLWRYLPDGTPDTTFGGTNGRLAGNARLTFTQRITLADMAIDAQGRIILAGEALEGPMVMRVNSTGTLDTTFGGSAHGAPANVPAGMSVGPFDGQQLVSAETTSLALASDGRIGIVGNNGERESEEGFIALFNSDGSRIDALNDIYKPSSESSINGSRKFDGANAAAFTPDGGFLVGGFDASGGDNFESRQTWDLRKFPASGTQAWGWTGSSTDTTGDVESLAVNADGTILVAGNVGGGVVRLTAAGAVDTSFGVAGHSAGNGDHLALLADGRYYLLATGSTSVLTRWSPNGTIDALFPPFQITPPHNYPSSILKAAGDDALMTNFVTPDVTQPPTSLDILRIEGSESAHRNSKGTLQVFGTSGDDTIQITYRHRDNRIVVRINGGTLVQSFPPKPVKRFQMFGFGGNDKLTIGPGMKPTAYLVGGDGNDTLAGGNAVDTLIGGAGNDTATRDPLDTYDEVETIL